MKAKILITLLLISTNILAAPAAPGERTIYQSDGTSFTGELQGDEWFNWVEDKLGRVIQYNPSSSNFEYSVLIEVEGGLALTHSGVSASDNTPLGASMSEIGIINKLKLYKIARQFRLEALYYSQEDSTEGQ